MSPAVLSWSGGKDATLALRACRGDVERLMTTVNADADRVSMHGVRRELVEARADALGLPLDVVELPADCGADEYADRMAAAIADYPDRGIESVVFADLFLGDIREYREENLAETPLDPVFPLWGRDTAALAREFVDAGFEAILCTVDGSVLDESFAGREFDHALLDDLPADVDPCGENGEFHTFVVDGPLADRRIPVDVGERVTRELQGTPYHYVDLVAP